MIDANRLVYNNMVTACKIQYNRDGKVSSVFDLNRMGTRMRRNSPYVAEAYSLTLNETSKRVVQAFKKTLGDHKKETGMFFVETKSRCAVTASPDTSPSISLILSRILRQGITRS
jgi:putative transposase